MDRPLRHVPLIRNARLRTCIGFILLLMSLLLSHSMNGTGAILYIALMNMAAWLISVFFTDKYVHKYPQRYFTYLAAVHVRAAVFMAVSLWLMSMVAGPGIVPPPVLWSGFLIFVATDALASALCRREAPDIQRGADDPAAGNRTPAEKTSCSPDSNEALFPFIDAHSLVDQIPPDVGASFAGFIENHLPGQIRGNGTVSVVDDIKTAGHTLHHAAASLLIGRTRLNDVLRLNNYMQFCTDRIHIGGYFAFRYLPFENYKKRLRARYNGPFYWIAYFLHFVWYRALPKIPYLEKLYFTPLLSWLDTIHLSFAKKRNRALSKAEVWGRLCFWGMEVRAESDGDGELFILAQRTAQPVRNKVPSFYMITALDKVGLDGKVIHTHKIRTMSPFSEFLQARIFQDHGLASTGKFANDFRLTDYGAILRKYWLDELPQILDWLRGEIKLVGIRATSPHFLSLYPKEFYDLYIQVKPGLIPPIFDESTNGFEQIVAIEFEYLRKYAADPVRTDIQYFCKTFKDIVFRGVRSK